MHSSANRGFTRGENVVSSRPRLQAGVPYRMPTIAWPGSRPALPAGPAVSHHVKQQARQLLPVAPNSWQGQPPLQCLLGLDGGHRRHNWGLRQLEVRW